MKAILRTAAFLRRVDSLLRFGDLSRERLNLTRVELKASQAACDWIARDVDMWDGDLPEQVRERHYALQVLQDAIKMREIVFAAFDGIENAELKAYRTSEHEAPQLVLAGTVHREANVPARVTSLAMRAKLLGFQFSLADGAFMRIVPERSLPTEAKCSTSPNAIQRRQ